MLSDPARNTNNALQLLALLSIKGTFIFIFYGPWLGDGLLEHHGARGLKHQSFICLAFDVSCMPMAYTGRHGHDPTAALALSFTLIYIICVIQRSQQKALKEQKEILREKVWQDIQTCEATLQTIGANVLFGIGFKKRPLRLLSLGAFE
ncbi:putative cytochrome P450 4ad1 [Lucilia cuprina]|nr:putative cytochrome P450 4ad1 [Lucilia cuprina]